MKFRENEEAVSPVIGVILMVAITVILAAVIAAFVFGMAGNIQTTKTVAATATQQGNDIIVTYQGGADHQSVKIINVSVTNSTDNAETFYKNSTPSSPTVGESWTFGGYGTSGRDHVVVVAEFTDGTSQVVLDTFI